MEINLPTLPFLRNPDLSKYSLEARRGFLRIMLTPERTELVKLAS